MATPIDPSDMEGSIFVCDACMNAQFATMEELDRHLAARHADVFPQFAALKAFAAKVPPAWPIILSDGTDLLTAIGKKTFDFAVSRDGGEERMHAACLARAQLEVIVRRWHPTASVYIFGSSVAMGIWDGISDIDFTVIDVAEAERGAWPPNEKNSVRSITELLRRAGFPFAHLEPIPNARVPIIKHHAAAPIFPAATLRQAPDATEHVLARTVRYQLAHKASLQDRLLLEGCVRDGVAPDAVQQVWWDRVSERMSVTLGNTVDAMRALSLSPTTAATNQVVRTFPASDEFRPELFTLDFDLSFRIFGIRNSVLLSRYLRSHPCARPGALVLKDWSKQCGVNNSMSGYFTSYAVNIMWIYYLVQKQHVAYVDPLDIPDSLAHNTQFDPVYSPLLPPNLTTQGGELLFRDMGAMLLGFFYYYCFEFDWDKHVVSLNREQVTTKASLNWKEGASGSGGGGGGGKSRQTRYQLCIEDPYEENLNLGRHVGFTKERKVMQEMYRGLLSLIKDAPPDSCVFTNAELQKAAASDGSDAAVAGDGSGASQPPPQAHQLPVQPFMKVMAVVVQLVEERIAAHNEGILLKDLVGRLTASAGEEFALLRKLWSIPQLLHRMGYKVTDGMVRPRKRLGMRGGPTAGQPQAAADARPSPPPPPSVADLLVSEAMKIAGTPVDSSTSVSGGPSGPDWVAWNPPRVGLQPAAYRRFDPTGGVLPTAAGAEAGAQRVNCCAPAASLGMLGAGLAQSHHRPPAISAAAAMRSALRLVL